MRLSSFTFVTVIACCASTFAHAQNAPKLNLDVGIPNGSAMVCQFDRQVTEEKRKKTEEQVDYYAVISGKSAQLCDGEGIADDEEMTCKRFEMVGKNDGGAIIYVSDDGYKLTTNVLALAMGAGVSVDNLKMTYSTAYTGRCHNAPIATIRKWMADYKE